MVILIEVRSWIDNVHRWRLIELVKEVRIVAHIVGIVPVIDQARGTIIASDRVVSSVKKSTSKWKQQQWERKRISAHPTQPLPWFPNPNHPRASQDIVHSSTYRGQVPTLTPLVACLPRLIWPEASPSTKTMHPLKLCWYRAPVNFDISGMPPAMPKTSHMSRRLAV